MADIDEQKLWEMISWLGITNQLMTTRGNQMLADTNLPMPQFIMLNHFSWRPDEPRTISGMASAFQANQPTVTKTAQQLVAKGFLDVRPSEQDGRVKLHYLTSAGRKAHMAAFRRMAPEMRAMLADWSPDEVDTMHRLLFRLKEWLDSHRGGLTPENTDQPSSGPAGE